MSERPRSVLIGEDDSSDGELALEVFREPPAWDAAWVEDGAEALDYLFRRGKHAHAPRPDLVILNLSMPKVHGHGVIERVKGEPGLVSIPVVIWSVSTSDEDIHRAYRFGASGYLTKSPVPDEARAGLRTIRAYWERVALPRGPDVDAARVLPG